MLVPSQEPEASDMLHRCNLDCGTRPSLHRNTHTDAWPFLAPQAGRPVQSLDTEALPKFGKKKEASSLSGALSLCCLVCIRHVWHTDTKRDRSLGCGWVMLFLLAPAGLADTTDYTWGSQKQQG